MNNNGFIVNPATGRNISIGGRMWKKMVKQGIIQNENYSQTGKYPTARGGRPSRGCTAPSAESLYTVSKPIENIPSTLIHQSESVARRMHPPGIRNNKLTTKEASKRTADAAIEVIDEIQSNKENIPPNMTRKEAYDYLQGLIFDKMIASNKKFVNVRADLIPDVSGSAAELEPIDRRRVKIRKPPLHRSSAQRLKPLKRVPKKKTQICEVANSMHGDSEAVESDDVPYVSSLADNNQRYVRDELNQSQMHLDSDEEWEYEDVVDQSQLDVRSNDLSLSESNGVQEEYANSMHGDSTAEDSLLDAEEEYSEEDNDTY